MTNLSILFLSLFITVVMVPFFRRLAYKINAIDEPDERKVHARPIARTGGLAMAVGALVPLVLWVPCDNNLKPILFAAAIIVGAGFIDDLVGLGFRAKFGAQVLAAAVVVFYGSIKITTLGALLPEGVILNDWFSIPLTLIVIVGVTNAINLADGLDGLAGGISVISFIILGYLGYQMGDLVVVMVALAVIGAVFGFLRYNTYPATIFMGDAGSQLLGFLAVTMALQLTQSHLVLSPLLVLLLLGFPILDTLTVMLARIYHGRSPFSADKNHFHHKLMRLGLTHWEAVLLIYLFQVGLVGLAYALRFYSDWLILGTALGIAFLVTFFFYLLFQRGWVVERKVPGSGGLLHKRLVELNKLTQLLKLLFIFLQVNVVIVLLLVVMPVKVIPGWFAGMASGLIGGLVVGWSMRLKYYDLFLRIAFYLSLPMLIYWGAGNVDGTPFCAVCRMAWVSGPVYLMMIVLSLLLLKFTRRSGYKSTPLDFLILGVAILVPSIIPKTMDGVNMGMVAVRIIAIFFALEVVIEESRTRNRWLELAMIALLSISIVKWLC